MKPNEFFKSKIGKIIVSVILCYLVIVPFVVAYIISYPYTEGFQKIRIIMLNNPLLLNGTFTCVGVNGAGNKVKIIDIKITNTKDHVTCYADNLGDGLVVPAHNRFDIFAKGCNSGAPNEEKYTLDVDITYMEFIDRTVIASSSTGTIFGQYEEIVEQRKMTNDLISLIISVSYFVIMVLLMGHLIKNKKEFDAVLLFIITFLSLLIMLIINSYGFGVSFVLIGGLLGFILLFVLLAIRTKKLRPNLTALIFFLLILLMMSWQLGIF